jgi:hypothetical protein
VPHYPSEASTAAEVRVPLIQDHVQAGAQPVPALLERCDRELRLLISGAMAPAEMVSWSSRIREQTKTNEYSHDSASGCTASHSPQPTHSTAVVQYSHLPALSKAIRTGT